MELLGITAVDAMRNLKYKMSERFAILNYVVLTTCIVFSGSVRSQSPKPGEYRNWIPTDVGYYSDKYRECLAASLKQKGFYTQKIFSDCSQSCIATCVSDNSYAVEKFHSDNNLFTSKQSCLNHIRTTEKYFKVEKKYQKKKTKNPKKAAKYLANEINKWCGDPKNKGRKGYHRARISGMNKNGILSDTFMLERGIREKCRVKACTDDRIYAPTQPSNNLNDRLENIESMLEDLGANK